MAQWKNAVTDRSQNDIERVRELFKKGWQNFTQTEKDEWLNGIKGALNKIDLERIQNNIQLLSDALELNLTVDAIPEIPKANFYNMLVKNVEAIRGAYYIYKSTPLTPELPLNTYQKWNDIEKILLDVYENIQNNQLLL